jgi:hypothetical protein
MILILRGHIRNSFDDDQLYNLIKDIYDSNSKLEIYISTFNIIQNNISWRNLETINIPVTTELIHNYFKDLSSLIKKIIIIDDTKIKLVGKITGNVCKSPAPLIGWKRYWYCKFIIINHIHKLDRNKKKFVINCRFDIFNNSNNTDKNKIINLIESNKNKLYLKKNVFINDEYIHGIDNIYVGNIYTQYFICNSFYYYLDKIMIKHINITNQEKLVFLINNTIK